MKEKKRPHSIKVPRLYKVAAGILSDHCKGEGSIKTLVYSGRRRHPNVKAVYALASECVRRRPILDKLMEKTQILENEKPLGEWLARVLMTEMLWGKKKGGKFVVSGLASRPALTVNRYEGAFRSLLDGEEVEEAILKKFPRFVRVNRLKSNVERVMLTLLAQGYRQKLRPCFETVEDFVIAVNDMDEDEFVKDFHLQNVDLLVFHPKAEFFNNPLYRSGDVILQDKASCLTVAALDPPAGTCVLDACAAPGMKTVQAVEAVKARVVAVERDRKRCAVLRAIVAKHGANKHVEVVNEDFLKVDPSRYKQVEYIIVDPSCSGSGIAHKRAGTTDLSEKRITKLSALQSKLLCHALSFENVKRVAYSTCSTNQAENEDVVHAVMHLKKSFRLKKNVLPQWKHRGMKGVPDADAFIRSVPETDLAHGFFVAILERVDN